jgi:hypothetical protein
LSVFDSDVGKGFADAMRWWAGANDAPSSNPVKIYHEEHEAHGGMAFLQTLLTQIVR